MGREFELKYRLTAEQLYSLRENYGPFTTLHMETVYYDTPENELGKRRWTFRRRMENGTPVCTLKTPAVNGARGEWEVSCDQIKDAPELLIAAGAPAEFANLIASGVVPTCGARFTRLAVPIRYGSSLLELALDQGELLGGKTQIPFAELEVELKEGIDADAEAFAAALAQKYALEPEPKSKFARARQAAELA